MSEQHHPRRPAEPTASRPHIPGYGILDAQSGKGLLCWSWATERLTKGRAYWLATTRPDGCPHVMPVWGIWLDGTFYFSTGKESRKARNLAADTRCVVATEILSDELTKDAGINDTVIVEGVAEEVTDPAPRQRFADIYAEKYKWDTKGFSEPLYAVHPSVAFGFTSKFVETATRWTFEEDTEG